MTRHPPGLGSYENGDPENEDLRPPMKTKTHYKNKDPLQKRRPITKMKTPLQKRRHITKKSSKEVGFTFVDKDYIHETHYKNEDPYRNLEF